MQQDHVLKKVEFWKFDPQGWKEGGLREKYLLPCCCIHDSLQFDMNMTLSWKSWFLTYWPHPQGWWGRLQSKYLLPCCFILWLPSIWYATWPCSKKLSSDLLNSSPVLGCYKVECRKHQNQWWLRKRISTQSLSYAPRHLYVLRYGTFSNISPI